jgi:glycine/D-amino acid oxidase-like deaminating enzyme
MVGEAGLPAREAMDYDVVVVGAGPAGLAAAIRLKQLDAGLSVVVVEKGSVLGAHILSGAVIDPIGLDRLIPDEEGVALVCDCPLRRRIRSRDEFRRHGRGGAERRVVESGKVLCAARAAVSLISSSLHSLLGIDSCWLASAAIKLASTANPSALTRPSAMQRCTTLSKSRRSASLSRKRPCLFFENVE